MIETKKDTTPLRNAVTLELEFSDGRGGNGVLYFEAPHLNDAVVTFARKIVQLDDDADSASAYVSLRRLPDVIRPTGENITAWIKSPSTQESHAGLLTLT